MLKTNTQPIILSSFVNPIEDNLAVKTKFDLLQKLRQWCDEIEINDPQFARLIAKVIPAQYYYFRSNNCPYSSYVQNKSTV